MLVWCSVFFTCHGLRQKCEFVKAFVLYINLLWYEVAWVWGYFSFQHVFEERTLWLARFLRKKHQPYTNIYNQFKNVEQHHNKWFHLIRHLLSGYTNPLQLLCVRFHSDKFNQNDLVFYFMRHVKQHCFLFAYCLNIAF